jgi:hypothetical protein
MNYYTQTVLSTSDGGVDMIESVIYTLVHRAIRFTCVPVAGGCQFTVPDNNRRDIEETVTYLDSVKGHEVPQ